MFFPLNRALLLCLEIIYMVLDVLILGAFYASVRGVDDAAEILHKYRFNSQNGFLRALTLDGVAHRQSALIVAFLEIYRRQNLLPLIVKNLAWPVVFGKQG